MSEQEPQLSSNSYPDNIYYTTRYYVLLIWGISALKYCLLLKMQSEQISQTSLSLNQVTGVEISSVLKFGTGSRNKYFQSSEVQTGGKDYHLVLQKLQLALCQVQIPDFSHSTLHNEEAKIFSVMGHWQMEPFSIEL